jgi:Asp-tRNA(Asn)/Glu-tRNA(Gln) amidotransferase A subunit family amidase
VEPFLNSIVDNRFDDAIKDAQRADKIIRDTPSLYIIENYPLLGVPFTVKESIAVKGLSYGTATKARIGVKAEKDALVVEKLRAVGAIPLLVSTTPEYCLSWECNNLVYGRTMNPHNLSRTSGGSSGGEAALNSAGASCFGVGMKLVVTLQKKFKLIKCLFCEGSDIAGSIRIPSMFVGIFGHKPTPGIISLDGHFPNSIDKNFNNYLTIGPMCRYSKDLAHLTKIMSNEIFHSKLRLDVPISTSDIRIFYLPSANEFSIGLWNVDEIIQRRMLEAVSHFKSNGVYVEQLPSDFTGFDINETLEISISTFFDIADIPDMLATENVSAI